MGQNMGWIILGVLIFAVGFMVFVKSLKKRDQSTDKDVITYKDGVPILPRNQRLPSDETDHNNAKIQSSVQVPDALDQLAAVAATRTQKTETTEDVLTVSQSSNQPSELSLSQSPSQSTSDDLSVRVDESLIVQKIHHQEPSIDFEGEMPALDNYFSQQHNDNLRDNQALFAHEQTITVVLSPRNKFAGIDGQVIMRLVRQYALKYGVLNAFHRYENPEGTGVLWFSMLGVGNEGVEAFDLLALPEMNYRGLSLFLPLPHPQALRGFDSMIQVAMSMAEELDADICDEAGYLLDANQIQALRAMVSGYHHS